MPMWLFGGLRRGAGDAKVIIDRQTSPVVELGPSTTKEPRPLNVSWRPWKNPLHYTSSSPVDWHRQCGTLWPPPLRVVTLWTTVTGLSDHAVLLGLHVSATARLVGLMRSESSNFHSSFSTDSDLRSANASITASNKRVLRFYCCHVFIVATFFTF